MNLDLYCGFFMDCTYEWASLAKKLDISAGQQNGNYFNMIYKTTFSIKYIG